MGQNFMRRAKLRRHNFDSCYARDFVHETCEAENF